MLAAKRRRLAVVTATGAIDERIRELVRSHRTELEQLVDEALDQELAQLVEQRVAARNGAPPPATNEGLCGLRPRPSRRPVREAPLEVPRLPPRRPPAAASIRPRRPTRSLPEPAGLTAAELVARVRRRGVVSTRAA